MKLFLAAVLLFGSVSGAQAACDLTKIKVVDPTVDGCISKAEEFLDDEAHGACVKAESWRSKVFELEEKCLSQTQKIESADKDFLSGAKVQCDAYVKEYRACETTLPIPSKTFCWRKRYRLREAHAKLVSSKKLFFGDAAPDLFSYNEKIPPAYRLYAKKLCELPKTVWIDKKIPGSCEARVLSALGVNDYVEGCD